jgi:hypothetical protein
MTEPLDDGPSKPLRVSDAMDLGYTREELRTSEWEAPFWGIRSRSAALSVKDRAAAFLPRMPERAFYFGATAAVLQGIPVPRRKETVALHVGVPTGTRRVEGIGVVAHHVIIDARDLTVLDGLPVSTPARTWCDLSASGLQRHEVTAAGDRILWSQDPLASHSDLRSALARFEGRRGTKLMRDALPILSGGSASVRESWVRVLIIDAELPPPTVQVEVMNQWGRRLGHCDLGWPYLRIGLEYEGDHHRTDQQQWQYDIRRYREMEQAGWVVIRVTAADLADSRSRSAFIRRLRSTISARVRTLG